MRSWANRPAAQRALALAALLAAYALRLYRLGAANLWWDEALAIWAVRKGLAGVTLWTAADVHPPLYFWSLWGWVQLAGESEFAMRWLSLAFGVLTVAAAYALGRLVVGGWAGVLGAWLTALSRFHVWWSQEMRMYVLAGLAGTLALYLLLRWLRAEREGSDETPAWALLAGCTLASWAALYTVFLMGALQLAQNLVVLIAVVSTRAPARLRILWRWAATQAALAVAVVAWLALSWGRMRTWSVAEPVSVRFFARLYATLLATGISVHIERYTWAMLLPLAVLGLAAAARWLHRPRWPLAGQQVLSLVALTLAVVLPAGAVYLASLPRALFYTPRVEARYLLPFAPAFWVLLGWAAVSLWRRLPAVGALAAVSLLGLFVGTLPGHYANRYLRDELQTMVRAVVSQAQAGDVVLLNSGSREPMWLYHYQRVSAPYPHPPTVPIPPGDAALTTENVDRVMSAATADAERVWLAEVDVALSDPDHLARHWLEARFPRVLAWRYGHNVLLLYAPDGEPPRLRPEYPAQHPLPEPAALADGELIAWELPAPVVTGGDTAHVSLLWEESPSLPVTLEVLDEDDRLLWAQRQPAEPVGAALRQQFDVPIYAATPAGSYLLRASVGDARQALGALQVSGTRAMPRPARHAQPLAARVGETIWLEGYALSDARGRPLSTVRPGAELWVELHWRAEAKPERDYTAFVHLLGEAHNPRTEGPVWAQHDGQPVEEGYPTSQWLVGDLIVDRHPLTLDAEAPPGVYRLVVGLYTPEDVQRLAVYGPEGEPWGDQVLLPTETTVGP